MNKVHDSSYKFLFSNPEFVRDLIMGFIPDDWLHSLDYETLEKVPGSYITDDFKQGEDDIVWRVMVGGEWVYLYLLIEFQSSVDKYMALRMMVYVGLLYQDLIKRGEVLVDGRLQTTKELGTEMRKARKLLGLTQSQLALTAGVGIRFIVDLESGKPILRLEYVLRVIDTLGGQISLTGLAIENEV
jgi:y4mF family transcriptional regulator